MNNSSQMPYGGTQSNDQGYRIDLNNFVPDRSKANDLRSRLYDSGISNIPMPSVKRPIEENISARPFSARMNSNKIQSLSPLKKKIQNLNTNIISNLNESYKEAAKQEAKYKGEGTAEYYRSQQVVIPTPNVNMQQSFAQQKVQMGHSFPGPRSMNKHNQVAPLDPEVKKRINDQLQPIDAAKITQGPPSLVYAGFEGGMSMSQRNLEVARSKFLLDKLTGKLPPELRQGRSAKLAPIEGAKSTSTLPSQNDAQEKDDNIQVNVESGVYGQDDENKKESQPQKWTDLDKYIELLLDSKSEEETVFLYLNPKKKSNDPYDLEYTSFGERNKETFYTISGKGLTQYDNDVPVEFLSLGQWLIERDSFNHIKQLNFFRQFKKWKFMRMWKKTIKQDNRYKAQTALEQKLFILQDHFSTHLYEHRRIMIEMESLRFVDECKTSEPKSLDDFTAVQEAQRKKTSQQIKQISDKSRENIRKCIAHVLTELRTKIMSEIALDESRKRNNALQSSTAVNVKRNASDNALDKLGFPEGMTYGHRSALRKECSCFLRFAYLADFLSLEALSNIYTQSVALMIDRLQTLNEAADMKSVMERDFDESNQQHSTPVVGRKPLFGVKVQLNAAEDIPETEIVPVEIDEFLTPPRGDSKVEDFDLLAHVEVEPEKEEGEEEEEEEEDPEKEQEAVQKYKKTIPNIQKFWVKFMHEKEDFVDQIVRCFDEGLDQIAVFTRWSKHSELSQYADALEDWDEKVGDMWDAPDQMELTPRPWISENDLYKTRRKQVEEVLDSSYSKAHLFLGRLQPLLEIYWRNKQFDKQILVNDRVKSQVETMGHVIRLFEHYHNIFQTGLPGSTGIGLLQLDTRKIRTSLLNTPRTLINEIEAMVPVEMRSRTDACKAELQQNINNLKKKVENVEDFVQQKNHLDHASEIFQNLRDRVDLVNQYYNCLAEFQLKVKKEDNDVFKETMQNINQLSQLIQEVESSQESNNEKFKKVLNELIPELDKDVEKLHEDTLDPIYLDGSANILEVLKTLEEKEEKFAEMLAKSERYLYWQEVLGAPQTPFDNIEKLKEDLSLRSLMWKSTKEWEELQDSWVRQPFKDIDAKGIEAQANNFAKICNKLEKSLEDNEIQRKLKNMVETFRVTMPVVTALRQEALEESHWSEIQELVQGEIDVEKDDFTLQNLIALEVEKVQDQIIAISSRAKGEATLKKDLAELKEHWTGISLQQFTKQYKDKEGVFTLVDIDVLYEELDQSLAAVNVILGNRYVSVLRAETEAFKKDLNNMNSLIEEMVACQKQWMYLETIFLQSGGGDIKKLLSREVSLFEQVDKFFRQTMGKVNKANQALKFLHLPNNGDLINTFKHQNAVLEQIQKELDNYLATKRDQFPRFYFMSDEELLEILANSDNKDIIQMHLKTLFDNIVKLTQDEIEITHMHSREGEGVKLSRAVKSKGSVEAWLDVLQTTMKDTLVKMMKLGIQAYNATPERKDWVLTQAGQIVATVAQIKWCEFTEVALLEMGSNPLALQDWLDDNQRQLKELTKLVQGELTDLQRKIIVALVTTDVHARDIIEQMKDEQVSSIYDFNWQKQLRYYWDDEKDECNIKQVQASLKYGFEYMGATSRLVITPLTDKCWMTITGALHIKLGANPAGPAGTGKTESTKDLAKALAILCIVYNCSDQVDYKMMGRLFTGLCLQGAWTCLDEFNRIKIEVLSVIAQQLLTVRKNLLSGSQEFMLDDKQIDSLKPEFGCHVTMNPGYAGRTELPDNLKVLFRPVAMMIPNYGLIAQIILYAEGFEKADELSKKMVQLYQLSSQQLSQQDHYDFGMRAVKSVLVMAGDLRRKNPDLIEDAVLIRAMQDANVPKFLKDDLPLFGAIVQDLFPTVEVTQSENVVLTTQIKKSCVSMELQPHPVFVKKTVQLFETFNVRFGVMLVGFTGSGKTCCYNVLQDVMTKLREKNDKNMEYQVVKKEVFNPKAISMGELYGEVDFLTQEWTDGLASKIMRAAANEEGEERTWVVFDGPVDALWIENMNTVLDDNMTLCLANGQRLKLRPQMRMLFEVQDLAVASPATVSRCGMVYMTPEDLGWRPFVKSWIERKFPNEWLLSESLKTFLWETFEATIDIALDKIRTVYSEPIKTDDLQLVRGVCNLLEVFIQEEKGFKGTDEVKKKDLDAIFAWCYTWGLGASIDEKSKDYFDTIVRDSFKAVGFPSPPATVFDIYYDLKKDKMFRPWDLKVEQFTYVKDKAFFELVVPTTDTYKHRYCLEQLLSVSKPIFFTGQTGVGKSVIIQNTLDILSQENLIQINMNFSAQTTSLRTQQTIEAPGKLEKKKRTVLGAPINKRIAIFVDDINMPAVEEYGAQPPIEFLRLFIDRKGLFERKDWIWKYVEDTTLVCAAAPPGGGRSPLTPRFTTHFNMFCVPIASAAMLSKIFGSILGGFLNAGFQEPVRKECDNIINSTVEVYNQIGKELRPTPAKFHYSFNLRDVSKVIQGILMSKPLSLQSPENIQKLWVNEIMRVFHDRLINSEDKQWILDFIMELLQKTFRSSFTKDDLFGEKKVLFSDILKLEASNILYEEIKDQAKLIKSLKNYLEDYNTGDSSTMKMNLVLFDDAVDHMLRIARVLRQPRGNIMLIGVGGSGKQSLIRLCSFLYDMEFKQIEITKDFGVASFRDFIKELMMKAGVEGKKISFALTDSQILTETFVEDINNELNTGEIPNLMTEDDTNIINNDMRPIINEMGKEETPDVIKQVFVERVRANLHVCLCMSPVGDSLRIRCRNFPSLVNCCTLDWFSRWPEEALLYVSSEFLKELELPSDEVRGALAKMCMRIHTNVETTSERFWDELRRRVYTTPKSYLDLISLYINSLDKKRQEYNLNKQRLATGLRKLNETNESIAVFKVELAKMQPILIQKNEQLKVALEKVTVDKAVANEKEKVVSAEAEIVAKNSAEAKAIKDDADADLAQAAPELAAAQQAVQNLDKAAITEVKSFPKPPAAVEMVMEAVMVLIGQNPKWDNVKKVLNNVGEFMRQLQEYNVEKTPESTFTKVRNKWFKMDGFNPKDVQSKSSAAATLCTWALAVSKYQIVTKKVAPKKKKLAEVTAVLEAAEAELAIKMAQVNEVKAKVAALEADCQKMLDEKTQLENNMKRDTARMKRAEKLVVLLKDEGVRWAETVKVISDDIEKLVGNVFLSSAVISYQGAFTGLYRKEMTDVWVKECIESQIPTSEDFSLVKTMGQPVVIRDWNINGLPTDEVSIQNGILTTTAERWGLCIDPQQQCNSWIKRMYKSQNIEPKLLKFGHKNFLQEVSAAVRNGLPVLIEDVKEYIDPALDPLLLKQDFAAEGNIRQINLGDKVIEYDDNFKLYMTSKMSNPIYPPEVCIKVTLINFSITFQGLEEQLLGDVVVKEKPEVEQQRDKIVVTMAADQATLQQTENTILEMLSTSTDEQILDEDNLINVLEKSKITSKEINGRIEESLVIEETVNNTRSQYLSVAVLGSLIYFVISDMANVNDMYQNSLQFVKTLFNKAIDQSEKSDDLPTRLESLKDTISKLIYTNISRGLFEADKLIFSYLICTSIKKNAGKISQLEINHLLRGAMPLTNDQEMVMPENPQPKLINKLGWLLLYSTECNIRESFGTICDSITNDLDVWEKWATSENPHRTDLPLDWNKNLTSFQKLIVLKAFRPEKLLYAFTDYVQNELGQFFIESPATDMETIFANMNPTTPLVFILSVGADPTQTLMKFAEEREFTEKLYPISLGQGQEEKARDLISRSAKAGDWVMLQNCHLGESFMPELEKIVAHFPEHTDMDPEFRLFLTSNSVPYFPVSVLQNSIKLTTEPPRGLKANLKRTYATLDDKFLEDCKKPELWRKLLFGLSFFHAIVQERRKFGPLGWNIRYEFNDSDLQTSFTMLKLFLDEQEEVPWDALLFMIGSINYGGRVTDYKDLRCLVTILQKYCTDDIKEDDYKFSESEIYYAPQHGLINVYRDYIEQLPLQDNPEIFGLHDNANISYQKQESDNIVDIVLSIQPRVGGSGSGMTPDEMVLSKSKQIAERIPEILERSNAKKELMKTHNGLLPSLTTVLLQEISKFNRLLTIMKKSLFDLDQAIQGYMVMSEVLDKMYVKLLDNKVPANWERWAYPSLKPLGSWFEDLIERVAFMENWLVNGNPSSFWMPGMFYPQGFLTGCLQTHSRQYTIAIDKLDFTFQVLIEEDPSEIEEPPEDGVYIYGLFVDGARWNREEMSVDDQHPGEMYDKMPFIWFKPVDDYKQDPDEYVCPCYKTSTRAGVLSTTGQSTNFILDVDLPTKVPPKHWIQRATALLCQLND